MKFGGQGQNRTADTGIFRTDVEDLARGFAAAAVDYIMKPVKQPEMHARVATHLQIHCLIAQQREHLAALEQARGELETLNDAKDKFLSNLGREVSTSLAQIADTSASIRESAKTPEHQVATWTSIWRT